MYPTYSNLSDCKWHERTKKLFGCWTWGGKQIRLRKSFANDFLKSFAWDFWRTDCRAALEVIWLTRARTVVSSVFHTHLELLGLLVLHFINKILLNLRYTVTKELFYAGLSSVNLRSRLRQCAKTIQVKHQVVLMVPSWNYCQRKNFLCCSKIQF